MAYLMVSITLDNGRQFALGRDFKWIWIPQEASEWAETLAEGVIRGIWDSVARGDIAEGDLPESLRREES